MGSPLLSSVSQTAHLGDQAKRGLIPRIGERHEIRQLLTREAPGTEQGSGLPLLGVTSWSSCSPLTPAQLRGFIPGPMWGTRAESGHSREQVIFLVATALAWIPI